MGNTSRVVCVSNTMPVQVWCPFPYKVTQTASLTVGREYDAVVDGYRVKVTNDSGDVGSYPGYMFEAVDCTYCTSFRSFADDYFDPKEPHEYGFCNEERSPLHGNCGAGVDEICTFFSRIQAAC